MHDSWGCGACRDCKVSIVFVTMYNFSIKPGDERESSASIGSADLDEALDSREEEELEELRRRSASDRLGLAVSLQTLL